MGSPVVHFEIGGPDGPALQQFYRDLFGWTINLNSAPGSPVEYGLVQANEGGIGGGVLGTTEEMPCDESYVSVYMQVDDLQGTLDRITAAGGGMVVPPMEIAPGMGSISMFKDPADNLMGLYALPSEWDGEMPPKGNAPPMIHFSVGGKDPDALVGFYSDIFGWRIQYDEANDYQVIQEEEGGIGGGIFRRQEGMPCLSLSAQVDDIQAYLDKAESLGGKTLSPPTELAGEGGVGTIASFADIAGNAFALFTPSGD